MGIGLTNMIFSVPDLNDDDRAVLELIARSRNLMASSVSEGRLRWTGMLRRQTLARSIRGSNSIEGYDATLADAVAIIDDDAPDTMEAETRSALIGYRNAMTYILSIANDPHTVIDATLIRSLHFTMLNYDMSKMPGKWRSGPIYVIREETNETVYEAPDALHVPALTAKLVEQIQSHDGVDPVVMGAMAHLNLTMIHPFKDGNGRMARALQTLVMARSGIVAPEFSSIEEWLGRNTEAYYAKLEEVGRGHWNPDHDAGPWVRFCLTAYYQQLETLIRRNVEAGEIWMAVETLRQGHGLHERVDSALVNAALGYRILSHRYRVSEDLSEAIATRDLRRLCEEGLLVPHGEKRGRFYTASEKLKALARPHRQPRKPSDPYETVRARNFFQFE